MRVILEKGDKPEVKELVRQLQKLVPGIVIIEDEGGNPECDAFLLGEVSMGGSLSHLGRLLRFPRRGDCVLQQDQ